MGYPKGLEWNNGYAFDGSMHYFLCQKSGHKRIFVATKEGDKLRKLVKDHNDIYHTAARRLLPVILTTQDSPIITVDDALSALEARLNDWSRGRQITASTVAGRTQDIKQLRRYLRPDDLSRDVEQCGRLIAARYVTTRRDCRTTGGARIRKELQTLLKAAAVVGVKLSWDIKTLEASDPTMLKVEHRQWLPMTVQDALRWISRMAEPEKSLALMKFYSGGARDTDLFCQKVGNVNFGEGGWTILLHKKTKGRIVPHWQPLEPEAMEILERICRGKGPDELVFTTNHGRPITWEWLEYRLARSSTAAGLPKMKRFGWIFRHLAITYLVWKKGPREAQQFIGHSSVTMTERYDRPELFAEVGLALRQERRAASAVMGELVSAVPVGEPIMMRKSPFPLMEPQA